MSARTILKHVYENGGMTEYQYERIDRVLKERERPHGEWIEHRQFNPIGVFYSEYECSVCHDDVWQKTEWHFCPHCGADMRKEGEAE